MSAQAHLGDYAPAGPIERDPEQRSQRATEGCSIGLWLLGGRGAEKSSGSLGVWARSTGSPGTNHLALNSGYIQFKFHQILRHSDQETTRVHLREGDTVSGLGTR